MVSLSAVGGFESPATAADSASAQLVDQDANIQISPQAMTSEIDPPGSPVTLTGHVDVACDPESPGCTNGFANAPTGTPITFSIIRKTGLLSSFGTPVDGSRLVVSTTCATVLDTGSCEVKIDSPRPDTATVRAATSISFDAGGDAVTVARATGDGKPGDGPDAVTTWVASKVQVGPSGSGHLPDGSRQTLVATVGVDNGTRSFVPLGPAFVPAPDGTVVTFVKDPSSTTGAFSSSVGGPDTATCTTTNGMCSVDVDSSVAGSMKVTASAAPLAGPPGSQIAVATGVSGPATRIWLGPQDADVYAPAIDTTADSTVTGNAESFQADVSVDRTAATPVTVPTPTGLVVVHHWDWNFCTGPSVDEILQLDADGKASSSAIVPPSVAVPMDPTSQADLVTTFAGSYQVDYAGDANYLPGSGTCTPYGSAVSPLAPPHQPAVKIDQSVKSQPAAVGDGMTFEITVTNTGDVQLDDVTVTDPLAPDCNRTLGTMAPDDHATYDCAGTAMSERFTNRAFVVATSPFDTKVYDDDATITSSPVRAVSSAAAAQQPVSSAAAAQQPVSSASAQPSTSGASAPAASPRAGLEITQKATAAGGTMTFTITVTNTGDVPLMNVRVSDPVALDCQRTSADLAGLASLAPGAAVTYTCTLKHVGSVTNVVAAAGVSTTGDSATAGDALLVTAGGAALQPVALRAAVAIAVSPIARKAKSPRFEIRVTNTGKVGLHDVTVNVRQATACNHHFANLGAGKHAEYACSPGRAKGGALSSITVVGTSPTGLKVEAGVTAKRA